MPTGTAGDLWYIHGVVRLVYDFEFVKFDVLLSLLLIVHRMTGHSG